jgi:16S rRNA (adenine1518-N6/adenine1519-N6)-dimethyltransferase
VLSILIRHKADAERVFALPPGAFRPLPQVHSAVVRLRFHAAQPPARDPAGFSRLVQAIFTRRRKTVANALRAYAATGIAEALERSGIDGRRRPETLDIRELAGLSDAFTELRSVRL